MKKTLSFAFAVSALFLFASCGAVSYRSDLSASEVGAAVEVVLSGDEYAKLGGEQLLFRLEDEESVALVLDSYIHYNSENYDEFGVLKTASVSDAKKIKSKIDGYYFPLKDGFMKNYNLDLYEKISGAECRVYGVYVVYTILTPDAQKAAHEAAGTATAE